MMGLRYNGPAAACPIEIERNVMKSKRYWFVMRISARRQHWSPGPGQPMTGHCRPTGGGAKFNAGN
jgi:hypothetical protein